MPQQTVTVDVHVRPDVITAYVDGELLSWHQPNSAQTNLIWPEAIDNHAAIMSRRDGFTILDVQSRIYPDGVGEAVGMYGPQKISAAIDG